MSDKLTTHWESIVFRSSSGQLMNDAMGTRLRQNDRLPTTALLYVENEECSELLVQGLANMGIGATVVTTPLNAIVQLQDVARTIRTVLVSLQNECNSASGFLDFLEDEHAELESAVVAWHSKDDGTAYVWAQSRTESCAPSPERSGPISHLFSTERHRLRIAVSQDIIHSELW